MKLIEEKIALFGGTTEGRLIGERLLSLGFFMDAFVATEYGREGLSEALASRVICGRLNEKEMEEQFQNKGYGLVIDATHPYARLVSENIRRACERTGCRYLRVVRDESDISGETSAKNGQYVEVGSVREAVSFLAGTEGNILVTTGSKELSAFLELPNWEERIFARVLPLPESMETCFRLGIRGSRLIAMQGPFSLEMNVALLHSTKAKWMVTKESGRAGGFEEKRRAAREAGAALVVVKRPQETGLSLKEAMDWLEKNLKTGQTGKEEKTEQEEQDGKQIILVGTGPGSQELLTEEAKQALERCSLLAGSVRCLEQLSFLEKEMLPEYRPEPILAYLKQHREHRIICVALSGDTGFYSGASRLYKAFSALPDTTVSVIPGISTVSYFFSRIGKSWEQTCLLSLHGKEADVAEAFFRHESVFLLGGSREVLADVCGQLLSAGLSDVRLTVGENLSLPKEQIISGFPEELKDRKTGSLTVIYGERTKKVPQTAVVPITHGLEDDIFLRGKVPMTKMEVRSVSISKLGLTPNAVVWDIGAGTGSVSLECARLSKQMTVYAVERNQEAVELIRKNREQFGLPNLELVSGTAPDCLDGLPAPSHVFIGGSGGRMEAVIEAALRKNPAARFTVNVISLESLAALSEYLRRAPVSEADVVQVTAARSKKAGNSHLMMGQNPVWIITFFGVCREDENEVQQ